MARQSKAKKRVVKKQRFKQADKFMEEVELSELMDGAFARYSKYNIKFRSIPDVRDGLLPVQRRTLYAMDEGKYFSNKQERKSAKIVGEIMGNYHPHGDSGIYGAMARMSKHWIVGETMVNMVGNNGNIDGDREASMRYTESKLTRYSEDILLSNLSLKGLVPMVDNYDDFLKEPVYLPAKLPNILVNGSEGIAVGHATNIPPFNIGEILDACIVQIERPDIEDTELLTYIPAPDLPLGGTISGYKEYQDVLISGRGTIKVRGNYHLEEDAENQVIVFTEIPYGVTKPAIIEKINIAIEQKEVSGIVDVIDETADGVIRLSVICNKSVDINGILSFLFAKTPLQTGVPLNANVISNGRPRTMGIPSIIREFNIFRLNTFVKGLHIQIKDLEYKKHLIDGLLILLDNIEDFIKIIRASESKADAKVTLMEKYNLSNPQIERILSLSLHRLSKSDNTGYLNELTVIQNDIDLRKNVLSSEENVRMAVVQAYKGLKETYAKPRKTVLIEEMESWEFNPESVIPKENVVVGITEDGFIKLSNARSYKSSTVDNSDTKYIIETDTTQNLILVDSKGSYAYIPVHKLPLTRWADKGKHLSTIGLDIGANKVAFAGIYDGVDKDIALFLIKNSGVGKQTLAFDYVKNRGYYSLSSGIKCKPEEEVIGGFLIDVLDNNYIALMDNQYANMYFKAEEMPITSKTSGGSSAMGLNKKQARYITEFELYQETTDIPEFCVYRERGKVGWNRKKTDEPVSLFTPKESEEPNTNELTEQEEIIESSDTKETGE